MDVPSQREALSAHFTKKGSNLGSKLHPMACSFAMPSYYYKQKLPYAGDEAPDPCHAPIVGDA